ncbi:9099_t:CDS:2, partial [Paraglomus brasilianum]
MVWDSGCGLRQLWALSSPPHNLSGWMIHGIGYYWKRWSAYVQQQYLWSETSRVLYPHILPEFIVTILLLCIIVENTGSLCGREINNSLCRMVQRQDCRTRWSAHCLWSETTLGPVSITTQLFFLGGGAADRIAGGISSQHTP